MPNETASPGAHESNDALTFNEDDRAVLMKELAEQASAYSHLYQLLKAGPTLAKDLTRNILYLGEARTATLCKMTGIELDGAKEREDRFARIRALNERNRDLEQQLGLTGTVAQTAAHLKTLARKFNHWWDLAGFGHVTELHFTKYGSAQITVSCHLFGDFPLLGSTKPVSDEVRRAQWFEDLKERGFVLEQTPGERDPVLVDCDQNREALTDVFQKAFPSCDVAETSNHYGRDGTAALKSMRVFIRDLAEIDALPMPTTA